MSVRGITEAARHFKIAEYLAKDIKRPICSMCKRPYVKTRAGRKCLLCINKHYQDLRAM